MKRFGFWIFLGIVSLVILLFSCAEDEKLLNNCGIPATVKDLSGLDGCGFVFELEDGTRLIPYSEFGWCGTPPLPEGAINDPLYDFQFADGKKILIGYKERNDVATICMAGKPATILCLEEIETDEK